MKVQSGLLMASLIFTSAGALFAIPHEAKAATLFSDGFESGTFGSWSAAGGDWSVINDAHGGSKAAEVKDTGSSSDELRKDVSTSGYSSIVLSYWYKIPGGLANDDELYVQWWDGSTWQTIVNYDGSATVANWVQATHNLPAGANNKSNFKLRFLGDSLNTSDKFRLDDVNLLGTAIDTTAPTVTINQAAGQSDPTGTSPILFTVQFNETVTGFATGDVTLSGTAGATTATVTAVDGDTYTVSVSGMTGNGTVIATVGANKAQDGAGNGNAASTSSDNTVTYTGIDTSAPTVTINQAGSQADPTYVSPINFTVEFSESVTGFASGDVSITGTAGGSKTVTVTGSGSTYNVAVSGMTTAGTVIASVPAGAATDTASNASLASTATDNTVLWKVNSKPVAQNASYETDMNQDIDFVLGATDADGDPLTWEIIFGQEAEHGDVTGTLPNVNYDPDLNYTGEDDFSFRVNDGFEWSDAAQITIDIEEPTLVCEEDEVLVEGECVPDVPQEPGQCTVVSNSQDFYVEGEVNATELVSPYLHEAWADNIAGGAKWIWGDAQVEDPNADETQTFTKTFSITDVPSAASLEIAADNGARVEVNGIEVYDTIDGLTESQQNYNDPADIVTGIEAYLVAGANTIEIEVKNLAYPSNPTPTANPAGVIYKLTMEDADCGEPADSVTIVASKLVCTDESELPNWGMGGGTIGANTATQWVADHETCSLVPGWKFQVGGQDAGDPGRAYIGEEGGYTTFGPTNASGVATVEYELAEGVTELHLREVLKHGFIPFTFDQENPNNDDDVSAEFYCQGDVLNYDNWDFIRNPVTGETYYCVAWNVPDPEACEVDAKIVLKSGDADEAGLLTKVGAAAAKVVGEFIHESWIEAAGQWIWKDAGTSEADAADGVTETFTRTFEVVGTPEGATLDIAADNKVTVKVNGETLIALTDEDNYSATTTVPVPAEMLVGGENEIEFVVENIDHESLNTPTDNPAGLLYVLTVTDNECEPYEAPQQYASVTMCKAEYLEDSESYPSLPGWTLMLLGDHVEDVAVPVNTGAGANTVAALDAGASYVARVSGTWLNDREPDNMVDAEYSTEDNWGASIMDGFTGYGTNILELEINGTDGAWGPYNASHQYAQSFVPAASGAANFAIDDTFHGDNSGSLAVSLYEGYAGVTGDNGCVTFAGVPYGSYAVAETPQAGWSFEGVNDQGVAIDGMTVSVNSASENFTVFNSFEEENGGGDEATLRIVKHAIGGNGVFDFELTREEVELTSASLTEASVAAVDGYGTTTLTIAPGEYDLMEQAEEGWTFESATCEHESEPEIIAGESPVTENGVGFVIEAGETVICTFVNSKDEDGSDDIIYQDRNGNGSVNGSSGGQVAGATDEACEPLITEYLGKSYANPAEEVTKLQEFLNGEMGSALPLTGTFGPMTEAAVRSFQVKYWEDVLKPWFAFPEFGVLDSDDSTGIVYKTTKWKINEIVCPGSEALPTLP